MSRRPNSVIFRTPINVFSFIGWDLHIFVIVYCGIIFIRGFSVRGRPKFFWFVGTMFRWQCNMDDFINIKLRIVYWFVGM